MTAPGNVPAVPQWYGMRDINYTELSKATETSSDTLFLWHKHFRARGKNIGHRMRGSWFFSCQDLVAFSMAAACARMRHPINAELLAAIADHVAAGHETEKPLFVGNPGGAAVLIIHAPLVYASAVEMMTTVRDLEEPYV